MKKLLIGFLLFISVDSFCQVGAQLDYLRINGSLSLYGISSGSTSDSVMVINTAGIVKRINAAVFGGSQTLQQTYANGSRFTTSATQNMAGNDYTIDSVGLFKVNTNKIEFFENAQANNNFSTAIGLDAISDGASSVAIGESTHAFSDNSIAIGFGAAAVGQSSVAIGSSASYGYNSTSFGLGTHARGDYSISGGIGTVANDSFHVAFGTFNDTTATDKIFTIGNGNDELTRSNALQLYKNGLFQLPYYSTADTNKVAGFDVNGNVVLRTKSTTGGGITSLNGLTGSTQTFATGTSGTDFAINSTSTTHTFNIPDAGASARGLITTGTQTIAGAKTLSDALTLSTLATGASTDSILTSASGVLRKRTVSDLIGGSAWGLSGNSITPANFIGTTSNNDLNFRTNNLLKFTIDSTGTPTTVLNLQYYFGVPALYAGATAVNSQFFSLLIQPTNTTISAPNGTVNISNAGVNTTYFGSAYSNFAKPVLLDAGSSGATAPATSAILDVVSTTKGVLLPRMTTTQRDAISSPATGLITYVTDSTKLSTYDGVRWTLTPKVLINTATLDFGNTSAQNSADLTITVTGAADGDMVSLGVPNASTLTNSSFTAWVSATNTVTVRFNNYSSGSQDPASGTFKVQVFK